VQNEGASVVNKVDHGIEARPAFPCVRVQMHPAGNSSRSLQEAMPSSDPAYLILRGTSSVLPASCWTFRRVRPKGELKSLFGSHREGQGSQSAARRMVKQKRGGRIINVSSVHEELPMRTNAPYCAGRL
jgi:hypothetical protein